MDSLILLNLLSNVKLLRSYIMERLNSEVKLAFEFGSLNAILGFGCRPGSYSAFLASPYLDIRSSTCDYRREAIKEDGNF